MVSCGEGGLARERKKKNRGDSNAHTHHLFLHSYSGTVGAAREGALSARAAVAISLDDHKARDASLFTHAADVGAAIVMAVLGELARCEADEEAAVDGADDGASARPRALSPLVGRVVNVNVPAGGHRPSALALAHQGGHCWRPGFEERFVRVASGDPPGSPRGVADSGAPPPGTPGLRFYFNVGGAMLKDTTPGADTWALKQGFAAVTLLDAKQQTVASSDAARLADNDAAVAAVSRVVVAAGEALGMAVKAEGEC